MPLHCDRQRSIHTVLVAKETGFQATALLNIAEQFGEVKYNVIRKT